MAISSVLSLDTPVQPSQLRTQNLQLPTTKYVDTQHDQSHSTLWLRFKPSAPPCFRPEVLDDLQRIREALISSSAPPRYQVLASHIPEVFSLGGDLQLFGELVRNRDHGGLLHYAERTVDLVYSNSRGHGRPITTISLVQGAALGGGFEAALSSHLLVAERGTRFGFPEVLFNLFPGMGAYTLLRRRVPERTAERIIMEGNTLLAEELHDLNVVDYLAEPGEGERVVRHYIELNERRSRGRTAFRKAVNNTEPVSRHELMRVAEVWVDTALELTPRDLKVMDFLVRSQKKHPAPQLEAVAP